MQRDGNGHDRVRVPRVAANDNTGSEAGAGDGPEARIDAAVMRLACLLGRQIARDQFRQSQVANDNVPDTKAHDG